MAAIRSKRICRVVWFDQRGRFAKAPKALPAPKELKPVLGRQIPKRGQVIHVDGGGTAIIQQVGRGVVKVRYIPPAEIRQDFKEAQARRDIDYIQGYKAWTKEVNRQLAQQTLARIKDQQRRQEARIMERSFRSDQAKKAASTRNKKRQSISDEDRKKAINIAKSLSIRIEQEKIRLEKTKNQKEKSQIKARIKRLSKAVSQLEKIASGKAYKWPSASQMR